MNLINADQEIAGTDFLDYLKLHLITSKRERARPLDLLKHPFLANHGGSHGAMAKLREESYKIQSRFHSSMHRK